MRRVVAKHRVYSSQTVNDAGDQCHSGLDDFRRQGMHSSIVAGDGDDLISGRNHRVLIRAKYRGSRATAISEMAEARSVFLGRQVGIMKSVLFSFHNDC